MVIQYTVVLAIAALIQTLLAQFAPELALGTDVFVVLVGYILIKIGVVVVGGPVAAALVKRFRVLKQYKSLYQ